jgi:hypothetical protein
MSDDAEVTMMLPPIGLLPKEEDILKRKQMEDAVVKALLANSITARPVWKGSAEPGGRVVRLILPAQPELRTLLELPASELQTLSADELNSRLNESIRRSPE